MERSEGYSRLMHRISVRLVVLFCLVMGLAPFRPEPHLVKCYNTWMDPAQAWTNGHTWDVLFHGAPFILLIVVLVAKYRHRKSTQESS